MRKSCVSYRHGPGARLSHRPCHRVKSRWENGNYRQINRRQACRSSHRMLSVDLWALTNSRYSRNEPMLPTSQRPRNTPTAILHLFPVGTAKEQNVKDYCVPTSLSSVLRIRSLASIRLQSFVRFSGDEGYLFVSAMACIRKSSTSARTQVPMQLLPWTSLYHTAFHWIRLWPNIRIYL